MRNLLQKLHKLHSLTTKLKRNSSRRRIDLPVNHIAQDLSRTGYQTHSYWAYQHTSLSFPVQSFPTLQNQSYLATHMSAFGGQEVWQVQKISFDFIRFQKFHKFHSHTTRHAINPLN